MQLAAEVGYQAFLQLTSTKVILVDYNAFTQLTQLTRMLSGLDATT